jgi:hypothetical protein
LKFIPGAENSDADELAMVVANNLPMPEGIFYQILKALATQVTSKALKTVLLTESKDWRQLIIDCLKSVQHLEDEVSVARMVARARSYMLIDGVLYKNGVVQPLLRCIG